MDTDIRDQRHGGLAGLNDVTAPKTSPELLSRLRQHAQATVAAEGAEDEARVERVAQAICCQLEVDGVFVDDYRRVRLARAAIAAMEVE